MLDENGEISKDYKIHCFDCQGNKRFIVQVDSDRFNGHVRDYYTSEWERICLTVKYPNSQKTESLKKPPALNDLIKIADVLSQGFSYVRVDLYAISPPHSRGCWLSGLKVLTGGIAYQDRLLQRE